MKHLARIKKNPVLAKHVHLLEELTTLCMNPEISLDAPSTRVHQLVNQILCLIEESNDEYLCHLYASTLFFIVMFSCNHLAFDALRALTSFKFHLKFDTKRLADGFLYLLNPETDKSTSGSEWRQNKMTIQLMPFTYGLDLEGQLIPLYRPHMEQALMREIYQFKDYDTLTPILSRINPFNIILGISDPYIFKTFLEHAFNVFKHEVLFEQIERLTTGANASLSAMTRSALTLHLLPTTIPSLSLASCVAFRNILSIHSVSHMKERSLYQDYFDCIFNRHGFKQSHAHLLAKEIESLSLEGAIANISYANDVDTRASIDLISLKHKINPMEMIEYAPDKHKGNLLNAVVGNTK